MLGNSNLKRFSLNEEKKSSNDSKVDQGPYSNINIQATNYMDFYEKFIKNHFNLIIEATQELGQKKGHENLPNYLRKQGITALNGLYAVDLAAATNPQYHKLRSEKQIKRSLQRIKNETLVLGTGKRISVVDIEQFGPVNTPKKDKQAPFKLLRLAKKDPKIRINTNLSKLEKKDLQFYNDLSSNIELELRSQMNVWELIDLNQMRNKIDGDYLTIILNLDHQKNSKTNYFFEKSNYNQLLTQLNTLIPLIRELEHNIKIQDLNSKLDLSRSTISNKLTKLEDLGLIKKDQYYDPSTNTSKKKIQLTELCKDLRLLLFNKEDQTIINTYQDFNFNSFLTTFYHIPILNCLDPPIALFLFSDTVNLFFCVCCCFDPVILRSI